MAFRIPLSGIIRYGMGIFGWSLSINIISVMLLYLYLPPENSGMKNLVPQTTIFGLFNLIALVTAAGRLFDAVIDPVIANRSDRLDHRLGRRIPLMRWAVLPLSFFATLMCLPPDSSASMLNLRWIFFTQLGYYFFFAMYVIPYNALLAELGHYPGGKMHLSTAQSVGFILGVVCASMVPLLADLLLSLAPALSRLQAMQGGVVILNILGGVFMAVAAFGVDERKYCLPARSSEPVLASLKSAWAIPNFRLFAMADAAFFFAVALITAGLLYYVKVLLLLPEAYGTPLMGVMVAVTLCCYPLVNYLEKKYSKKKMMIAAFLALGFVFAGIWHLGRYPVSPVVQVIVLMVSFGLFDSFLGILPNTVVADIAEEDSKRSGQNREGMFFGMRALFQKIGQTLGVVIFAMLTLWGKDPGNDLGLRMSGAAGAVLCFFAAWVYGRYRE